MKLKLELLSFYVKWHYKLSVYINRFVNIFKNIILKFNYSLDYSFSNAWFIFSKSVLSAKGNGKILLTPVKLNFLWLQQGKHKTDLDILSFILTVIFVQHFHFWILRQNFNCHTSPTSMPNFCIGFWNDIGDKNLRKTIFEFYQFPVKIILVGLCLKALNSIEKLHHPS